jgi:ATP-binding cassette subfamily B protein/ATP-binding cassette subfamily C protein LapB|tara:strand:- start:366401 stop:368533 length:2133 start_codon:yes stop_codon:yes gene_type:complete
MSKQNNTQEKKTNPESLKRSLQYVMSVYGIHTDMEGILMEIPGGDTEMTPGLVLEVAQRVRLNALWREKMSFDQVLSQEAACIIIMDDGEALVVLPQKTHKGKIFRPGEGYITDKIEDVESRFTKQVIILAPQELRQNMDANALRKRNTVDWFWKPILKHWPAYRDVMVATIFINIFALAVPLFTMNVYDRVVPNFAKDTLMVLTTGIALVLLLDMFFKVVRSYLLEHVATRVGCQFDFDLMERLMHLPSIDLRLSVGERVNLFRELQSIRDYYATRLAPAIVDFPFFLLFVFVIYMLSPALSGIALGAAGLILVINLLVQIPINRLTLNAFTSMQNKSSNMIETLNGLETIKMHNAIGTRLFLWNTSTTHSAAAARKSHLMLSISQNLSMMIAQGVTIVVVFFGVFEIQANEGFTIGKLIACSILSGRAVAPIMNVSAMVSRMKQSRDILRMIDSIFTMPYEGEPTRNYATKGPFEGSVEFREVSFQYPGQLRPTLSGINFKIEAGERVGIIGRTGAGKSTVAGLLTSFLHAQGGSVHIDGYAMETIYPAEMRRHIGIVPQKPFFFSGSIKENILLGNEDVTDEEFQQAAEISGLDIFVEQTGYGYDLEVGENGKSLSGGQQQSIAIARAFLKNPKILILDEPTNGMDNALELRVRSKLREFIVDKTFILITHRTSLLPLVDRLILLDKGRVMADGPSTEILKKLSGRE